MINILVGLNMALNIVAMLLSGLLFWRINRDDQSKRTMTKKKARRMRMQLQISPEQAELLNKIDDYKGGI